MEDEENKNGWDLLQQSVGVEDMINLEEMNSETLLQNIENRYHKKIIYTYTGSILVSMNPYSLLPIYTPSILRNYFKKSMNEVPPHLFAIADAAYHNLTEEGKNQCVLVSGESGAGKTEATKLILQYLAFRTMQSGEDTSTNTSVQQKLIEASPVLEAFGNAKTVRNNNSSRFGKFIEVHFNPLGKIEGAKIQEYLLEKTRIVLQAEGERNYHIFYDLFTGLSNEEKEKLHLTKSMEEYHYINQSGVYDLGEKVVGDELQKMKEALNFLGFTPLEKDNIFTLTSAILNLGNIQFVEGECMVKSNDPSAKFTKGSRVKNTDQLEIVASLLKIKPEKLEEALTIRYNSIKGEKLVVPLQPDQCNDIRDAMAKAIYSKQFTWLVERINKSLVQTSKITGRFIGVLDIFGFENFKENSFEQLCINFANEKLQQQFNQYIFKQEQEEYKKEEIDISHVEFVDNQPCLDLIESKLGIFSILDEESRLRTSTDQTFLSKIQTNFKSHNNFKIPRLQKDTTFGIDHYAGEVNYLINGFLDKNKDAIPELLVSLLSGSGIKYLRELFESENEGHEGNDGPKETQGNNTNTPPEGGRGRGRGIPVKKNVQNQKNVPPKKDEAPKDNFAFSTLRKKMLEQEEKKPGNTPNTSTNTIRGATKVQTVGGNFKNQLKNLYDTLCSTTPHYIRCIKPNTEKKPNIFTREMVDDQLRYSGMLETIRIRKAGFPVRREFSDFLDRFAVCNPSAAKSSSDPRENTENLIKSLDKLSTTGWTMGKTKLFFKDTTYYDLGLLRIKALEKFALILQSNIRMYKLRKKYLVIRKAAICFQAHIKGWIQLHIYREQVHAATVFQSVIRTWKVRREFVKQRNAAIKIQSVVKSFIYQKRYAKARKALIKIQSALRMRRQTKKFILVKKGVRALQKASRRYLANKSYVELAEEQRREEEERLRKEEEERKRKEEEEYQRKLEEFSKLEKEEREKKEREEEERRIKEEREREEKQKKEKEEKEEKEREKLERERRNKEEEEEKRKQLEEEENMKLEEEKKKRKEEKERIKNQNEDQEKQKEQIKLQQQQELEKQKEAKLQQEKLEKIQIATGDLSELEFLMTQCVEGFENITIDGEEDVEVIGSTQSTFELESQTYDVNERLENMEVADTSIETTQSSGIIFYVGDFVEAIREDDGLWHDGYVQDSTPYGSYIISFSLDGTKQETYPQNIKRIVPFSAEPGDIIEAIFAEDSQWYRARLLEATPQGFYKIEWLDYEGKSEVGSEDVRMLDPVENAIFRVHDVVEAVYSEDGIWYDAIVRAVLPQSNYIVEFTEYGNLQQNSEELIRYPEGYVQTTSKKSSKAFLDVNNILFGSNDPSLGSDPIMDFKIDLTGGEGGDYRNELDELDNLDLSDLVGAQISRDDVLRVGDKVEALYVEDGLWYSAEIEVVPFTKGGTYIVVFTEYGNRQETAAEDIRKLNVTKSNTSIKSKQQYNQPIEQTTKRDTLQTFLTEDISTMPIRTPRQETFEISEPLPSFENNTVEDFLITEQRKSSISGFEGMKPPSTLPPPPSTLPTPTTLPPPPSNIPSYDDFDLSPPSNLPPPPKLPGNMPPPNMLIPPPNLSRAKNSPSPGINNKNVDPLSGDLPSMLPSNLPNTSTLRMSKRIDMPVNLPPPPSVLKRKKSVLSFNIPGQQRIETISTLHAIPKVSRLPKKDTKDDSVLTLPENISSYKFSDWSAQNFVTPKKMKKKDITSLLTYQKKPIQQSLLNLDKDKSKLAVDCFSKLLSYGKMKVSEADWELVNFILYAGLREPGLRDEIYCQVLKQTRNAPDDAYVKMIEMISFLSCTFLPSEKLSLYVLSFLKEIAQSNTKGTPTIAKESIQRLLGMQKNKIEKHFIPTVDFELSKIIKRAPILVSIGFPGGNQKKLIIDSCTTFQEVQNSVLDKLGIVNPFGFAIYKKISKVYQKVIPPSDNVCDTVATISAYEESLKSKLSYEFIIRKRIFLVTEPPQDDNEKLLHYQQAFSDVLDGSLPCNKTDLIKLSALKLQYDYGIYDPKRNFTEIRSKYVPQSLEQKLGSTQVQNLLDQIIEKQKSIQHLEKTQVVQDYLDYVKLLPLYGTTLFPIKVVKVAQANNLSFSSLGSKIELGVNNRGICFYDGEKILHEHPFSRILNWEFDKKQSHLTFTIRGYNGYATKFPGEKSILEEDYDTNNLVDGKFKFHSKDELPPVPNKQLNNFTYPSQSDKVLKPRGFFGQWSVTVHSTSVEEIFKLIEEYAISLLSESKIGLAIQAHKSPMNELLNFEVGDLIEVIKKNEDGWFEGKLGNKSGFFPARSIQFLFEHPHPGQMAFSKHVLLPKYQSDNNVIPSNELITKVSDISKKFQEYAQIHFAENQKSNFKFNSAPLQSPLTFLKTENEKQYAVEMSTILLKYSGDYPVTNSPDVNVLISELIDRLLKIPYSVSSSPNSLSHEFFCQLLRMATNNVVASSAKKVWELIVIGCSVLGVHNKELRTLVESYLTNTEFDFTSSTTLLEYSLNALPYPDNNKEYLRQMCPSFFELKSIKKGIDMSIKIELPTKSILVTVHPYTTVGTVISQVLSRIGVTEDPKQSYFLAAAIIGTLELPLPYDSYIGDIICRWDKAKKANPNRPTGLSRQSTTIVETYQPEICLKKVFYYENRFDESDLFSINRDVVTKIITSSNSTLLQNTFYQYLIDIKKMNLLITPEEAVPLAACWAVSQNPRNTLNVTEEIIMKCFPRPFVETHGSFIVREANSKFLDLGKHDQQDAMIQFIKYCHQSSFFAHVIFSVQLDDTDHYLAVGPKHILILSLGDLKVVHKISFDEIASITPSSSSIKITYGNLMSQKSISVNTYQGEEVLFAYNKYLQK